MSENLKLTRKLKESWIANLESGKFKQIQHNYTVEENGVPIGHCCLAVLDETRKELGLKKCGWEKVFLSMDTSGDLIFTNDKEDANFKADYSNVLPTIRQLSTID